MGLKYILYMGFSVCFCIQLHKVMNDFDPQVWLIKNCVVYIIFLQKQKFPVVGIILCQLACKWWSNSPFSSICIQITGLQTLKLCAMHVPKSNFACRWHTSPSHWKKVRWCSIKSEKVPSWRRLGGWAGQTNTGLLSRRPGFMSCVKPKVNVVLSLHNILILTQTMIFS